MKSELKTASSSTGSLIRYFFISFADMEVILDALSKYYEPAEETDHYYSPYRSKEFNPKEWEKKLSVQNITYVENSCNVTMKLFNYELIPWILRDS